MNQKLSEMSYLTKIRELSRQGPDALKRFEQAQGYEAKIAWHESEVAECEHAIKLIEMGKNPEQEMKKNRSVEEIEF